MFPKQLIPEVLPITGTLALSIDQLNNDIEFFVFLMPALFSQVLLDYYSI